MKLTFILIEIGATSKKIHQICWLVVWRLIFFLWLRLLRVVSIKIKEIILFEFFLLLNFAVGISEIKVIQFVILRIIYIVAAILIFIKFSLFFFILGRLFWQFDGFAHIIVVVGIVVIGWIYEII